jgi:phosphohistidine phosphatase SixA
LELELWLMRHGEAAGSDSAGSDASRPLTERGQRQVQQFARWVAERSAPPDLIWYSPLVRARQTAELVAEEFQLTAEEQSVLSPGMDAETLLRKLAGHSVSRVICVGHQPDIGQALGEIIRGGRMSVSPGTCASVVFAGPIVSGAGTLRWLADPAWFGG